MVCQEKFFDSQNGTLTENFLATGGMSPKKILSRGPKVTEKGPRHKICLRAPCSSVTLLAVVVQSQLKGVNKVIFNSV